MMRFSLGILLLIATSFVGCGESGPNKQPKVVPPSTPQTAVTSKPNDNKPAPVNPELATANPKAVDVPLDSGELDDKLPNYVKSSDAVTGTIKSKGSDTMVNLVNFWLEGFKTVYPSVNAEIEHKGSGDAPKALTEDQATFGAMSRDWEPKELDTFQKAHGYQPTIIPTCIDMLAVYVHKDNPIAGLSLQQLDAIFSKDRKGGYPNDIKTWGDAGLTDPEWADRPIAIYGRNSASGTNKYFKDHALFKGTYKDNYQERTGSSAVIDVIKTDKYGIGYSGIGFSSSGVRIVPLSTKQGSPYVAAEPQNAYDESYPLARYLYLSIKQKPGEPLDPLRREFLKYVLSKQGQAMVLKDSYLPLPAAEATETIKTLEAKP